MTAPRRTAPPEILTAAWVAPISAAVVPDGAVAFSSGRILAVGPQQQVRQNHPEAIVTDLGNCVLVPGMVNAHVHLDLTHTRRPLPAPSSFVDWLRHVMSHVAEPADSTASFLDGVHQCVRFGVTTAGDIAGRYAALLRSTFAELGSIRLTSYGEVTAMAQRRNYLEDRLAAAIDSRATSENLRIGVSPHAPYSIEPEGYQRCLQEAILRRLPLTTHLAETPYEAEFLASHSGPFGKLWSDLGAWDDQVPTFSGGPIRYAQSLGLLDYPASLAHVNYCDDDEMALLAHSKATVVYCPRTHAYFGHRPHRWREMLACGINVALGTDSCASSPDLNLLDDARLLHTLAPGVPVNQIWQMLTVRGGRAVDCSDVGSLAAGKFADFAAFRVQTGEPLKEVLENSILPAAVWIDGTKIDPVTPTPDGLPPVSAR